MKLPDVIVVGAGGHAVVVADALLAAGRTVRGFVDADPALHGATTLGLPVLGDDSELSVHVGVELANGIGGSGSRGSVARGSARREVEQRLQRQGWRFATVLHPSAVVSTHARVDPGAQILAAAVVQALAHIGAGAIVNTRAVVEHHCRVGEHAHIAPGAVLCGGVVVGAESHVGAGAVVIQGLTLGSRVLVAAGAAVIADVAAGAVGGVPAAILGSQR